MTLTLLPSSYLACRQAVFSEACSPNFFSGSCEMGVLNVSMFYYHARYSYIYFCYDQYQQFVDPKFGHRFGIDSRSLLLGDTSVGNQQLWGGADHHICHSLAFVRLLNHLISVSLIFAGMLVIDFVSMEFWIVLVYAWLLL